MMSPLPPLKKIKRSLLNNLPLAGLGLLALFIILILFRSHHKLYQLTAETNSINLHFNNSTQNKWDVSEFSICEFQEIDIDDIFNIDAPSDSLCKPIYSPLNNTQDNQLILSISSESQASIQWNISQGLQVEISSVKSAGTLSGRKTDLAKKIILQRKPNNKKSIDLLFEGEAKIGTTAKLGENNLLRNGTIKVFEKEQFAGSRYLLGDIELIRGDVVSFISEDSNSKQTIVKGILHVSPLDSGSERGIYVTAYAGFTDDPTGNESTIEITRFGTQGYNFSPTLWKRIQADPLLNILISLFGMLFFILEFIELLSASKQRNSKKS